MSLSIYLMMPQDGPIDHAFLYRLRRIRAAWQLLPPSCCELVITEQH
jgi:hypothetical protein